MGRRILILCSLAVLYGIAASQRECGLTSLRGQGYMIRDSPAPGTRGLVSSGPAANPYELTTTPNDRLTRVLMWRCNDGFGAGFPINAICLSLLHGFEPVGFVSRGPEINTQPIRTPFTGANPTSASENTVWVCDDTNDPGACISAYNSDGTMVGGRQIALRECGSTTNYLAYQTFPPPPVDASLIYSNSALFDREFTFIRN